MAKRKHPASRKVRSPRPLSSGKGRYTAKKGKAFERYGFKRWRLGHK